MANNKVYSDYLIHGRTKGSRNGISTTKGYTAVGQKAKGRWVNGRYYYDYAREKAAEDGAKNDWQQQAAAASALDRVRNDLYTGKIRARYAKFWDGSEGESVPFGGPVQDQSYKNALAKHYARMQEARKPTNIGASQAGNTARAMTEYGNLMTARRKSKLSNNGKQARSDAPEYGAKNNWQQQGNTFRAANEAWERYGSQKSKGITGKDQKGNYGGYGAHASLEGSTRAMNTISGLGKLRKEKKNLSLYGSGDTKTRNSRSDIANAFADAKADAKNAFKTIKQKALLNVVNKWSTGIRKDKKKKKSWKDFFK